MFGPEPKPPLMELNEPAASARLFIALWPSPDLAARLCERCASACGQATARAVAATQLHLTLLFLGDVPLARLPALQSALCLPFSPFDLRLQACERWPRGLVVMVPDAVPPALLSLHAGLAAALDVLGLPFDRRALRPHVTLARRHAGPCAAPPQRLAPLQWRVTHYVLAESPPHAQGGYRILQTCSAQPAGPPSAPATG
jgi:RNA 2',3'-cyclic 3'-phosphodiesterase